MLLAIDIGNTNIHAGLFGDTERKPREVIRLGCDERRSADEYALLLSSLMEKRCCAVDEIDGVIIGSVVPTLTGNIRSAVKQLTAAPITVVGPGVKTGFPIRLPDPSELGADIAANAAGAIAAVGYPAIVIDFGTATVVLAVDKDKSFPGASILPGVRMSFDALGETGLLKAITGGTSVPDVGKGTAEAIRSGVLHGQAYAAIGLVDRYRQTLGFPDDAPVVVSGGYAEEILPLLPKTYEFIPHLTLRGLCEIYRINARKR